MDDSNKRLLILYAEEIVRQRMSAFDVSHDYLHVFRVRRMAMKFAENLISRSYPVNPLIVELAALFHDLCDHKYVQGDEASVRDEISTSMKRYGMDDKTVNLVLKIVDNVSNSTENRLRENGQWSKWHDTCLELHCVQDADRIDAIGAIGIMRASAYSCAHNIPLYHSNPSVPSAYRHYSDKLVLLASTMKTGPGKKVAAKRQESLARIVSEIEQEASLKDFDF